MFIAGVGVILLCQDPAVTAAIERVRHGCSFRNARVTWEIDPGVNRERPVRYGVHQYAGDQVAYEFHYPEMPPQTQLSDHGIFQGLTWESGYLEGQGDVRIWKQLDDLRQGHGPQFDFRRLGMDVAPRLRAVGAPAPGEQPDYRVSVVGSLVEVWRRDKQGQVFKWYLDPQKAYSVVESQVVYGSQVISKAVSTLREWSPGLWYPESVQYYRTGPGGELRLHETLRVVDFACDTPDLPDRLTPDDVGLDVGTNITPLRGDQPPELMIWDGAKPVPLTEFREREERGEVRIGRRFNEAVARMQDYANEQRRLQRVTPSLWEQYVRAFIARNRLDEVKTRRAWQFHDECKKQAEAYLARREKDFKGFEEESRRMRQAADGEAEKRLADKRRELQQPVEEIFSRLVTRLESLLPTPSRVGEPTTRPDGPAGRPPEAEGRPMNGG